MYLRPGVGVWRLRGWSLGDVSQARGWSLQAEGLKSGGVSQAEGHKNTKNSHATPNLPSDILGDHPHQPT